MNHRSIFVTLLACVALSLGATACAKPKDEDCKKAIANIRNLYGTAGFSQGTPPNAAVRSCRGSASREAVDCIIKAKTIQELEACAGGEFVEAMKGETPAEPQQAPAQPTPAQPQQDPAQAPAQPQQDPAQAPAQQDPAQAPAQQAPAQQDPAQAPAQQDPAQAPAQQDPAQAPAQPQQDPAQAPAQPGQQPPAQ